MLIFNKKRGEFQARFRIYFLSIFLLVAFHTPNSFADMYRWIDASGTIHISDDIDDIPPAYRNNFKTITEHHDISTGEIIPFERTASGLVLVNAILNGNVKAKLVFDTGANLVVITEALSKKLNQGLSPGDEVIKLQTSSGEVNGRSFVINKIELGNARKENVRSVIIPNDYPFSGFDGLLGISFLGDFKIMVDYENEKIIINK